MVTLVNLNNFLICTTNWNPWRYKHLFNYSHTKRNYGRVTMVQLSDIWKKGKNLIL